MRRRLLSLILAFVMILGMPTITAFAEATDVTVTDNVIDITNKVIYSTMNGRWHATVSSLTISGATIESATEDGTTINVKLADDTDPYSEITATFGWSFGTFASGSQDVKTIELVDGKATMTVVVTGKVNTLSGKATYTINFESAAVPTEPPAVAGETERTAEVYTTIPLELPVSEYFGKAAAYYLVEGESYTEIDETYSKTWEEPGTYTLVFAAGNTAGKSDTVTVTVTVEQMPKNDITVVIPEGYEPTFHAVTGIESGTAVLGDELAYEEGVVKVPQNVSRISWSVDGAVGMSAAVAEGTTLNLREITFTAETAAGDADSEASVTVEDSEGYTVSGTVADTFLLAEGSGYTYTVTPSSSSWNAATLSSQTVSAETAEVAAEFSLKSGKSITAPSDADVTMYYQSMYYKAAEVEPVYSVDNGNGTTTYYYACTSTSAKTKGYVYRATLGDNIVKAGYMAAVTDVTLDWSGSKSPSFRGNTYETPNYTTTSGTKRYSAGDGVYMNVNSTGHLVLSSGSSKDLGVFRIWEIIDEDTGNVQIQPDFHFDRVAGNDIYSLTPIAAASAYGNNWQTLTATGPGTAFLEVSFDAIHVVNGYESAGFGGSYGQISDYVYNASNPNQTGLIVLQTDGNAASDVTLTVAGKSWDAEIDTYYFQGDSGSLNLTAAAASGIQSVAVSNDKGSSWTTLTADESGTYTATVKPGNNIIRVTNSNSQTAYQVVRGAELEVTVTNLTDTTAGSSYKAGDKVRLSFEGLILPTYKMSGIYNPQRNKVLFTGTDGTAYATNQVTGYMFGVPYSYGGNDYYYTSIDVTIPSDSESLDEDGNYVLSNGYIWTRGFNGNGNEHRSKLSYNGVAQNQTATETERNRSVIEDIVLTLEAANSLPVMTGEDIEIEDMRLGQWHDVDLTQYFEDADGDELTYYILENGAEDWVALTDSTYRYFPVADGEQVVVFMALDGSMTLEEAAADENTAVLYLEANVAEAPNEVTITFSVTQGTDKFYTTEEGDVLSPRQITVPYFDLSLYGLEDYYYNPRCYAGVEPGQMNAGSAGSQASAEGVVTSLHAFIWATEVYQLGYGEEKAGLGDSYEAGLLGNWFSVEGGAGSGYTNLWNTHNYNYYLNMQYPLGCPGTGSTCDQQALYDGDVISIHVIEDYIVMGSSFSALVADEDGVYDYASDAAAATVEKGGSITLNAYHSQSDWVNYVTNYVAYPDATVVYIPADDFDADTSVWESLGTTNEDGQITIDTRDLSGGTYYIAVRGVVDYDASQEREMAMFTLTVEGEDIIYGDVNGDGNVNSADAQLIYRKTNGKLTSTFTDAQQTAADVNGDTNVNSADAQLIYRKTNGKLSVFPVEKVE